MPVARALPAARPLRQLCLLCLLPLASGLLDLYDDTFEEIIQEEPVLLVLFYDPRSTQFEAFEPVYEAAAAELGDEVPLARISANLEPRATARYAAVELPRLVVFRQGRDYRFRRGPGLPTQEELVIYMRQEAELAQTAMPSTMQLAWHGLADEISRLDREATSSITIIDTLGLDSTGRLLKLSERPDRRRLGSEEYHDRNWVAASLPLLGALTEEALREKHLAHFVGAPQYTKMLSKGKLRLPSHCLFALYVLYQRFGEGREYADPLWQAWLQVQRLARTGQHALFFWSKDELALLEEERLVDMANEWRESVAEQYAKLVVPLCELFPYFFPPERITEEDYARAVALVNAHLAPIPALNGSALLPLPMRHSPAGSVTPSHVVETAAATRRRGRGGGGEEGGRGEEEDEEDEEDFYKEVAEGEVEGEGETRHMVHLLHIKARPMEPGSELTLAAAPATGTARHNDQLLLEAGLLWDDLSCASVPLRFQLDVDSLPDAPTRRALLKRAGLDPAKYDWTATVGPVAEELLTWTRIMLAPAEELRAAGGGGGLGAQLDAMRRPLSLSTETEAINNLLLGMERIHAQYDHNVEEDELILAKRTGLSARHRLAVQQRRLSKLVLERQAANLNERLERATSEQRRRANSGSYSTAKERRRRADKVSKKERKREKTRAARKGKDREEL